MSGGIFKLDAIRFGFVYAGLALFFQGRTLRRVEKTCQNSA
jgi:hypothetical protein